MQTDLRDRLHDASASPSRDVDVDRLYTRARRKRAVGRAAAGLAALVVLGLAGIGVSALVRPPAPVVGPGERSPDPDVQGTPALDGATEAAARLRMARAELAVMQRVREARRDALREVEGLAQAGQPGAAEHAARLRTEISHLDAEIEALERVVAALSDAAAVREVAVAGRQSVYLRAVDVEAGTVTVDVIRFLTGRDAEEAYHSEHPDDPDGPPNDYWIVNADPEVRTLPVADDVAVMLVRLIEDGSADADAGTWAELPDYLADYDPGDGRLSPNPFWVTIDERRTVVEIEEQYVP